MNRIKVKNRWSLLVALVGLVGLVFAWQSSQQTLVDFQMEQMTNSILGTEGTSTTTTMESAAIHPVNRPATMDNWDARFQSLPTMNDRIALWWPLVDDLPTCRLVPADCIQSPKQKVNINLVLSAKFYHLASSGLGWSGFSMAWLTIVCAAVGCWLSTRRRRTITRRSTKTEVAAPPAVNYSPLMAQENLGDLRSNSSITRTTPYSPLLHQLAKNGLDFWTGASSTYYYTFTHYPAITIKLFVATLLSWIFLHSAAMHQYWWPRNTYSWRVHLPWIYPMPRYHQAFYCQD